MKLSPRARLLLIVALVLTLPLKFLVGHVPDNADAQRVNTAVAAFLARHDYPPRIEQRPSGTFIYATSGTCRLLIRVVDPYEGNLDSITISAREIGHLVFVYDGIIEQKPRISASILYHYGSRLRELLGFGGRDFPLLAVAGSDGCALNSLPWREVAEIV